MTNETLRMPSEVLMGGPRSGTRGKGGSRDGNQRTSNKRAEVK